MACSPSQTFSNLNATPALRLAASSNAVSFASSSTCKTVTPDDLAKDRKSTRLNSSHGYISYAVFCLKKKKTMSQYKGLGENVGTTSVLQRLGGVCRT